MAPRVLKVSAANGAFWRELRMLAKSKVPPMGDAQVPLMIQYKKGSRHHVKV